MRRRWIKFPTTAPNPMYPSNQPIRRIIIMMFKMPFIVYDVLIKENHTLNKLILCVVVHLTRISLGMFDIFTILFDLVRL